MPLSRRRSAEASSWPPILLNGKNAIPRHSFSKGRYHATVTHMCSSIAIAVVLLVLGLLSESRAQCFGAVPQFGRGVEAARWDGSCGCAPSAALSHASPPSCQPREQNSIYVSNSMLAGIVPYIPNLQIGYLHMWTRNNVNQGFLTFDYTLPVTINGWDVVFGETHGRFEDFAQTVSGSNDPNLQVLVGGGFRKRIRNTAMVGVNGFYNTLRLSGSWFASGIVGLEMAVVTPGDTVATLSFNYYGNVFADTDGLFAPFRQAQGDYKIEGTFTQPIFASGLDFRVRGSGYKLERGEDAYGWNVGADVTTRSNLVTFRYETGEDKINDTYHNLSVFVTVGFQPERLLCGQNPFRTL
jgi:hypothetical protein